MKDFNHIYPPKPAKHVIRKTLIFFTIAAGPDAPVSACRRAKTVTPMALLLKMRATWNSEEY